MKFKVVVQLIGNCSLGLGLGGNVTLHGSSADKAICHTLIVGIQWKEMEGDGTLGEAVDGCGKLRKDTECWGKL